MNAYGGAVLLAASLAMPATANEPWTVIDLGASRTEEICMNAAREAFVSFGNVFGSEGVRQSSWSVISGGLSGAEIDGLITCNHGAGLTARATLVVHSQDPTGGRMIAARLSQNFWDANERLGNAYLKDAFDRYGM